MVWLRGRARVLALGAAGTCGGGLPAAAAPRANRLLRAQRALLEAFGMHLAEVLGAARATHEAVDLTAAPTREAKRRGAGWLAGQADLGHSNRLGFFEGFQVLAAVSPVGVVSGFCFAPASTKEQPLAEDFLSVRHAGGPRERAALPSAGAPASGPYAADKGFEGKARHARWQAELGAQMLCAPKRARGQAEHPWPKPLRRWLASIRQIAQDGLRQAPPRLRPARRERPHCLQGFAARLAARVGLHNFCILLNRQLGRPNLAFVDLVDW